MYNKELKNLYLSSYNSNSIARSFLKFTEGLECENGIDLRLMSLDDVQSLIAGWSGCRIENVRHAKTVVRKYCLWCLDHGFEINYDLLNIDEIDLSSGIRKYFVASPSDLKSVLDSIYSKPEKETDDCLSKCFLWCAFSGVPYQKSNDIIKSVQDDLDIDQLTICIGGEIYEIYKESFFDFRNLKFLTDFKFEHPKYKKEIRRKRMRGPYLFRGVESGKSKTGYLTSRSIRTRISNKNARSNRVLKYTNVYISGVFYRAYLAESAGLEPDFLKYIKDLYGDVDLSKLRRNSGKNSQKRITALNRYRDTIYNYQNWKKVFYQM